MLFFTQQILFLLIELFICMELVKRISIFQIYALRIKKTALKLAVLTWRPQRDSNSRYRRERAMS